MIRNRIFTNTSRIGFIRAFTNGPKTVEEAHNMLPFSVLSLCTLNNFILPNSASNVTSMNPLIRNYF